MTGVGFVELEGGPFPEKRWSDLPVVILSWWADALIQVEVPTRREVQWDFHFIT